MKVFYRNVIVSVALTAIFAAYYNFTIAAHWIILFYEAMVIVIWLLSFIYSRKSFFQVVYLAELMFFFTAEIFKASIQVAWEVITPKNRMEAGIVAVPLDVKTNLEITVLSSLISLTPGTLSIDVSEDRSYLFVHAMYIPHADADQLRNDIKLGFEKRVLRIFN